MTDTRTALILADLEGITNIYDMEDMDRCQACYQEELRVYIQALLQSGVTNIYLCDAHDQGNLLLTLPEEFRDVNLQVISTVANIDFSLHYDFAFLVGFHGMNGSCGILPHSLRFNFQQIAIYSEKLSSYLPIGEVEIYLRWLGAKGIPVLLVAGDREAVYEGNCFNPYRAVCCIKSLFEREQADREETFQKIRSFVGLALQLKPEACLSYDSDPIYLTFTHEDLLDTLCRAGYPCKDAQLVYDSCTALVEDLYPLVERLMEFDKSVIAVNRSFLKELRSISSSLDRTALDQSEIGSLLNRHNLYSLNQQARDEIRAYLKSLGFTLS